MSSARAPRCRAAAREGAGRGGEGRAEEGPLHRRRVGDEDTPAIASSKGTMASSSGGASSRSTVRMPWMTTEDSGRARFGPGEAVKAPARAGKAVVDRDRTKGDDLVGPRVKAAELEIDDAEARLAPWRAAAGRLGPP